MKAIENASLRNIDVRIIIPHIPDKKIVFELTKMHAEVLMKLNAKIYEYTPWFIHAKSFLCDDLLGIIGTVNLDYRSLTHHFENGVWIYNDPVLKDLKNDLIKTMDDSILLNDNEIKVNVFRRIIRAILKIFAPLLWYRKRGIKWKMKFMQ